MFLKFSRITILLFLLTGGILKGQSPDNPWLISVGVNGVSLQNDFQGPLNDGVTYTRGAFKEINIGGPYVTVYRSIYKRFSAGAQFSLNGIKKTAGGNVSFLNAGLLGKYNFLQDVKVVPYAKAGWGLSSFRVLDGTISNSLNLNSTFLGGIGFDIRISGNYSFFIETSYQVAPGSTAVNYLQHSVGLSFSFKNVDIDNDGVLNKFDKCPTVPGLKKLMGCLDSDGDGVTDNEDKCPEISGTKELNGCSDSDGDGVLDGEDECPNIAGSLMINGCPDEDEDGVSDDEDKCPSEIGDPENDGCPWPDSDEDGVPDKDDKCPDEAGDANGEGCPITAAANEKIKQKSNKTLEGGLNETLEEELNETLKEELNETLEELNKIGENILFPADSYKLLGRRTLRAIRQVKRELDNNPTAKIIIEGYASSDGQKNYNLRLSFKRAEAVKAMLIKLGVDENRLEAQPYGEKNILSNENTIKGRAQNRRVEFKAKKY